MLDLLHIGASRAGSTWLWRALNLHPQIVFPIWGPRAPNGRKTGWFWNNTSPYWKDNHYGKVKERAVLTLDEYRKHYDPTEEGKVKIDITEGAAYIPESRIQLIKETYPDVRISYCIRNPITTLWSHIQYSGGTTPVEQYFTSNGGNYLKNVQYIQNLNVWRKYFPIERIRVYFFSEIRDNPIDLLKLLSTDLDVDPTFWDTVSLETITQKQNPNKRKIKLTNDTLQALARKCKPYIQEIEEHFDMNLSHWLEGKE